MPAKVASKRYRKAAEMVQPKASYDLEKAVNVLKEFPKTKFNESVEISVSLNIDPKKTDQLVRGTVTLPHGTGKVRRVICFCKGEKESIAKAAGADAAGASDLIQKVMDGWMEFDVTVATPDMMREVSRLGKVLGPRGLMPNPKAGTVTDDVAKAIKDVKGGKVEFKMDKLSNIHFVIGKVSFEPKQLVENGQVAIEAVVRARPSALKGKLIRRMCLNSTMSPGIPLKTDNLEDTSQEE